MTIISSSGFELEPDSVLKSLNERIACEIATLEKGDLGLIQEIKDGLEYRPMNSQAEFSPKERSEQFLKRIGEGK